MGLVRTAMVGAVVRREVREIVRNRLLVSSIILPPVLLTAAPIILVALGSKAAPDLPADQVAQLVARHPSWVGLDGRQVVMAYAISQFLATFLILPAYIPLAIASYSIVGEKQTRSLEAVLATPLRTSELLAGKAVAALVPGILASWLAFATLLTLTAVLVAPALLPVITDDAWLAGVLVLGPAVGLISVEAGIIVSSRVNDPRVAQQIGGIVILPILALIVLQGAGGFLVDGPAYLAGAAVLVVIAAGGLRLAVALFGRETILTRWR